MIRKIFGATVLMGSLVFSTVPVEAAELSGPGDGASDQIVVVNHSVTPVRVYVQDAAGRQRQLGSVARGQTTLFEAPEGVFEGGDFRVVVRPRHYSQFSPDQATIKTGALNVEDDETVILWLEPELSRSTVEVRQG